MDRTDLQDMNINRYLHLKRTSRCPILCIFRLKITNSSIIGPYQRKNCTMNSRNYKTSFLLPLDIIPCSISLPDRQESAPLNQLNVWPSHSSKTIDFIYRWMHRIPFKSNHTMYRKWHGILTNTWVVWLLFAIISAGSEHVSCKPISFTFLVLLLDVMMFGACKVGARESRKAGRVHSHLSFDYECEYRRNFFDSR